MLPVPHHIVSLNLCTDQYLLALADRSQIAAVTRFARDRDMSAAAVAAQQVPPTRATAEELLVLAPDLVLAAPYQIAARARFLGAARTVTVPDASDLGGIEANIGAVATAVGHPARGRALIASMQAELAAVPASTGRPPVVAYYQRGGYLTGTGTLVDDLIRRAGAINLAAVLHRPPLSRLSLEAIIAARPDYLLLERRGNARYDRGAALLDHPALARAFPRPRRLYLDEALTVCGGPAYPLAVATLRGELRTSAGPLPPPARRSSSPARR